METKQWTLDAAHSELRFKVKHMMISNVTGNISGLSAQLDTTPDFDQGSISLSAESQTLHTGSPKRDEHLKSPEFFDAAQFPTLTFEGKNFKISDGKVQGTLTMKGVTKPVALQVEFNGQNKDPWGNEKAGFSIQGKINRKDWGLSWNAALETGGVMVSEEVKIEAELQFVKK